MVNTHLMQHPCLHGHAWCFCTWFLHNQLTYHFLLEGRRLLAVLLSATLQRSLLPVQR